MIAETETITRSAAPSTRPPTPKGLASPWFLDAVCLAALTLAAILFFRNVLFGQDFLFPWDFIEFMYPAQRFISDAIHAGALPLWDPHVLSGYPIIADPQVGLLYPPYLLYHLLPWQPALTLQAMMRLEVAHIALAGMGAYGLARVMGVGQLGSLLAGLVLMLGGFFPVHVQHVAWIASTAWLPFVLLFTVLALEQRRLVWVVGLAVALALSILGGYTQQGLLAAYTALALSGWWLWRAYRDGGGQGAWRAVGLVVVGLALGGLLTMAQTLPTLDTVRETIRSDTTRDWGQYGALLRTAVVSLVLPTAFGSPGDGPYLGGEVTHAQKYMGLAALALTIAAFAMPLRNAYANFWRGLTLVSALGSLGPDLYVYRLVLLLPLMSLFRRPSSLYPIALLGAAVLSGMVIDRLVQSRGTARRGAWLAVALSAVLALAYAVGAVHPGFWPTLLGWLPATWNLAPILKPEYAPTLQAVSRAMLPYALALLLLCLGFALARQGRRWLGVALALLVFLDLRAFTSGQIFNTLPLRHEILYDGVMLNGLEMPFMNRLLAGGMERWRVGMPKVGGAFRSGANVLGFEAMTGYNPLLLRRMLEYLRAIPSVNAPMFDVMNTRYLLTLGNSPDGVTTSETFADMVAGWGSGYMYVPRQPLDPAKFVLAGTAGGESLQLWENTQALPRFWAASDYKVIAAAEERLAALAAPDFDPQRAIILETEPGGSLTGRLAAPIGIERYDNNGFQVRVEVVGGDTLLFISVPYHPGWRAVVENQPAPILPADHMFMAVRIPQGAHSVRLDFAPTAWTVGLGMTLFGVALCVALLALGAWRAFKR